MLILPLHQPITRTTLPWATLLLVLLNLWVFVVLQGGDSKRREQADSFYWGSGMAAIEAPLLDTHLQQHPDPELATLQAKLPVDQHPRLRAFWAQRDAAFRARLDAGELFASANDRAAWQQAAPRYRALRGQIVGDRWALSATDPQPLTAVSALFLHGGWGHLLGNMLFLLALGLLVEGPLGRGLFLLLYLAGGVAASLTWLASNSGSAASLVGASGAIAALMGAFCVLWGRRRVRFFYWFFVVFDYVRAPALLLLPLWLGWELLQWTLRDGERVAYEAHAGGIVAGAVLALLIQRLGWQRDAYFEAPVATGAAAAEADFGTALGHLERFRGRFDVALARYRCARYGKRDAQAAGFAEALLRRAPAGADEAQQQSVVLQEWLQAGGVPGNALRRVLVPRLLAQGDLLTAVKLARGWDDAGDEAGGGAQLLLSLALGLHQRSAVSDARGVLEELQRRYPQSAQSAKAAFLLGEWAG
jgi:membrane associated rhomboid family serine protease